MAPLKKILNNYNNSLAYSSNLKSTKKIFNLTILLLIFVLLIVSPELILIKSIITKSIDIYISKMR